MRKLIAVLGEFGFASLGLTEKDFLVPGSIIQLGYPPNRIDLVITPATKKVTYQPEARARVR